MSVFPASWNGSVVMGPGMLTSHNVKGGLASEAIGVVGNAFATPDNPARDDYATTIDTSFLQ